jgi:hypothetical protein
MGDNTTKSFVQEAKTRKATKAAEKALAQEAARAAHEEFVLDESNWEYVEIPSEDLFDKPFGNININAESYGPGKHFLDPDLAGEIKRIIKVRNQSDLRIYRPTADKKMLEIMARQGKPLSVAGTGPEVEATMKRETGQK